MRSVSYFLTDAIKTFAYIVFSPLQWLFWTMPRMYEVVITTIAFWKNSIPSKEEIRYTIWHWSVVSLILLRKAFLYISYTSTQVCISLHKSIEKKYNEKKYL